MAVRNYISKSRRGIFPWLTPRVLSYVIGGIAVLVGLAIFQPLQNVFAGRYILQSEWIIWSVVDAGDNQNGFTDFMVSIGMNQISFRYYAVMMLGGVLAGYFVTLFLATRHFIAESLIDRLFVGLMIVGLLGARSLYILVNFEQFIDPVDFISIHKGGLAIFGAFVAGAIYTGYYCWRYKFNIWEFGDFLAPGVLIGQVIGRFGNLFNYEAYGFPTRLDWKMYVPESIVTTNSATQIHNISLEERFYHPTFLYELLPNTIFLIWLLFHYDTLTERRSGLVLAWYMIGYGTIRFLTEFQRLDALHIPLPDTLHFNVVGWDLRAIHISQLLAFILFVAGIYILNRRRGVIFNKRSLSEVKG